MVTPIIFKTLPPAQIADLTSGDAYQWQDPNAPQAGVQLHVLTNQGGGSNVRLSDGAVGTLSSEVWVTPVLLGLPDC